MAKLRTIFCALMLVVATGGNAAAQHGGPPAAAAPVVSTPEARRADIAQFRSRFLTPDRSYSSAARAEAETRLARLEAQVGAISQIGFELELARIVALADNGHTAFFPGPRSRRYNRVAIRFAPFGEDFYVLRTTEANADLLGANLVAIDNHPVAEARTAARSLMGGVASWRDRNAGYVFESPDQLAALGVIAQTDGATYRLQLRDGSIVERRLAAEAPNADRPRANADRWFYPEPMEAEHGQWRSAMAQGSAPWALQEPGKPFRWRVAPEIDGMVIELRQNNDAEDMPIGRFMSDMRQEIETRRPRNLVLDMRMNGGGDLNTTRNFMKALPTLVPGRIFALTSPWTFSAAISSVGYLKQDGGARVTIVGEGVGDRLNFFSEGDIVELPNSHAMMLNATERHDYQTGCRGFRDCHGPVVRNPIAVPSLAPDIAAPWTIETYLAGRDPGMAAVAAALRN